MYFDQLLLAARKVHVVHFDQLFGAAHYIHFLSNHDKTKTMEKRHKKEIGDKYESKSKKEKNEKKIKGKD